MTDTLKEMIHAGDWLGIAKAITLAHVDKLTIKTFSDLDRWGEPNRYDPQPIEEESEAEEIDDDAPSSDTMNGAELDYAHGGRR
jgi:hypothetical protein